MSRQGLVPVNFFYYIIYYYLLCFNNQLLRPLKNIIAYLEYVYWAAVLCCCYCVMYKTFEPSKILAEADYIWHTDSISGNRGPT